MASTLIYTEAHVQEMAAKGFHLLVNMCPSDYLQLTVGGEDRHRLLKEPDSIDSYNKRALANLGRCTLPYLTIMVDPERSIVTAHDGRHRALAQLWTGYRNFPVALMILPCGINVPHVLGLGDLHPFIRSQDLNATPVPRSKWTAARVLGVRAA